MVDKRKKEKKQVEEIKLIFPTKEHKQQMEEYLQEHYANGQYVLNGAGGADRLNNFEEWLKKIQNDLSEERVKQGKVPATLYLAIRQTDHKLVGTIQIRHRLNEKLLAHGGNIGYGVRPSERRKGYAKQMLKLALEESKKLGLKKVLVTCYKENEASRRCIVANGGKLENERQEEEGILQRYWINLEEG